MRHIGKDAVTGKDTIKTWIDAKKHDYIDNRLFYLAWQNDDCCLNQLEEKKNGIQTFLTATLTLIPGCPVAFRVFLVCFPI